MIFQNELNLQFMHVFQSKIVVSENGSNLTDSVIDRSLAATFSDSFFIVMVDQRENEDM